MVKSGADERQALLPNTSENGLVQEYGTASSSGTSTPSLLKPRNINNPSKKDLLWILGGLWSAVFLGALDTTIVATLLSPIGSYFQKSHQASYLGTSYLLSVCCFTPLYGRLSDIMGRKGAMLLALSLFGTGTLLCGLANSMEFLIFARAVAGMGGGGVMTVSSIAVTDLIPLKQRGLYQGLANILFGLGSGIGGPLGGWINDTFGWRAAFLIQIPILVMSAIVIVLKVNIKLPDSEQTTQKLARIDYAGSFTLVDDAQNRQTIHLTLASALGMLLSSSLIAAWNNNTAEYHLWGDIVFGGFGGSSLITSTLIALIASVDKKDYAVATGISYLFRTTGQVLGVSLSGALVQAVLTSSLRKGITGPGAEEIILRIRHSTAVIPTLEAPLREVAVQSYEKALRSVFIGQAVLSFLAFLCTLPIEENPLPGSHEEQEQQERRRREASGRNDP
ncbi:major facilitator superfamily transporter [Ceratobasidium sp. AG-Ba]|nr:major facilitator superfamily transporter [Ceratobasidium sp. AG-Ba]